MSNNHERLNGYNGLALSPVFDKAFDAFLITFTLEGKMLLSPRLPSSDARLLGLRADLRLRRLGELATHLTFSSTKKGFGV